MWIYLTGKAASLDISRNSVREVPEEAFADLRHLQEVNLAHNLLEVIPDSAFLRTSTLRTLSLQHNRLKSVPTQSLKPLVNLEKLHLSSNLLHILEAESLSTVTRVQHLSLDGNEFSSVPISALTSLLRLQVLNLGSNKIRSVPNYSFRTLKHLSTLTLQNNHIEFIGEHAFEGLLSLKVLEINGNKLQELPVAIKSLPTLKELTFADNSINFLDGTSFSSNPQLSRLEMSGNPILKTEKSTFSNLKFLKKLTLSEARQLEDFPDLSGASSLEHLRLDRAKLISVAQNLCKMAPRLRSLNLKSNQITELPVLIGCNELRLLDLSYNQIAVLTDDTFLSQGNLIDLFLSSNAIKSLSQRTFSGLESLQVLDLEGNEIHEIHSEAFAHFKDLRDLNLGENKFPTLPTKGLETLRQLKTFNNRQLKDFPATSAFPRVNTLALSYAYHCCAFLSQVHSTPLISASMQENIVWLTKDDVDMASWSANFTDVWPGSENVSTKFEEFTNQLWKTWKALGKDYAIPDNLAQYAEEYVEDYKSTYNSETMRKFSVQCLPEPGPFMPCEDLFGWWSLRCGVWVVFLLALLGNGVVVIVLLVGRSKMDVPRFLVCNLAGADFFMGIYLGMLAVVDASTLGEFKVSAVKWQTSVGCQVAGFLGVLSSELSVFTLSVITLERNYAITHAMHLNKRLSLRHAGYIMLGGWSFAVGMAMLPLFGISDYRKFAVCLPFETEDTWSLSYVVFLILINGVAFLILMGCYLKMYCAIRGSQAWNSNDSRIARRMALLVFTDFICWAPIAFFSLTAVFGVQLISLEEAKVFTIFVLPLNSCANPFLYAIFTKQFKKDCVHICKRIEESRITRGIGRGRHSSNFSNRHTPVTTNSAAERKNAAEQVACRCGTWKARRPQPRRDWKAWALQYILCRGQESAENCGEGYTYAIAQIQKSMERRHKHTSSISSENFSSRSDSWRQGNIPLRLMDQTVHRGSWTYQRKASQDSNISCSRQDSSTSTFRMSRSSFSSDSSNQPKMCCARPMGMSQNCCECHNRGCPPKLSTDKSGTPHSLCTLSIKDKPKLCRQSAVADDCAPSCSGTKIDPAAVQKHCEQNNPGRTDRFCPACSRKEASPSLLFKNKELEEKFTCFYNRLVESSQEDTSEVFSSKEDHLVLSSDQSTVECGPCIVRKNSASIKRERNSQDVGRPHIEVNPMAENNDDTETAAETESSDYATVSLIPSSSQGLSVLSKEGPSECHHHLCILTAMSGASKCKSVTNIAESERPSNLARKVSSDNSLTKLSLGHLSAMFKSFSSQPTNARDQNLENVVSPTPCKSQSNLRTSKSVDVMPEASVNSPFIQIPQRVVELWHGNEEQDDQLPGLKTPFKLIAERPKIKTSSSTPNMRATNFETLPLVDERQN